MQYLIKDLCSETNFTPARIRKWQERFQVFKPVQGSNGYWYYTEQDLQILRSIQRRLAAGQKLNSIMSLDRDQILDEPLPDYFRADDWIWFQLVKDANYIRIQKDLESQRKQMNFRKWIKTVLQPLVALIGLGWEAHFITVSEEHAFSRWFQSYLMQCCHALPVIHNERWLVVAFPGDEHELGAMMHFAMLRGRGYSPAYAGMLPLPELKQSIHSIRYDRLSISLTLYKTRIEMQQLHLDLQKVDPDLRIYFGGTALVSPHKKRKLILRQPLAKPQELQNTFFSDSLISS